MVSALGCHIMDFLLRTIIVVVFFTEVTGVPIPKCCSLVSGSCHAACEQVSLVKIAIENQDTDIHLHNVTYYCTKELTNFWQCINGSLDAIKEGENWIGRQCCILPQSQSCQLACLKAKSKNILYESCRHSDEINFFNCVQHQEEAELCCNNALTKECRSSCWEIFSLNRTPTRKLRDAVVHSCANHSPKVLHCVNEHKKITPAKNPLRNIFCCDKSADENCKSTCKQALVKKTTEQEIVEEIESACGRPLLDDKLWGCFLQNAAPSQKSHSSYISRSRVNRIGTDGVKLQCCFKASTLTCRNLCFQTYKNDWSNSWQHFDKKCLSNLAESEMVHCLTEIDEPCKLGCEGLSYCSNFNDRSVELFQSCTAAADVAARKSVESWQKRYINIPTMQIYVQDIKYCHPEIWKAIACTLQIKPCSQNSPRGTICKTDCVNILTKCLDYNHLDSGHTPESLCNNLSPETDGDSCVSITPYLDKSPNTLDVYQVTHPCDSHNCNVTDVCVINQECLPNQNCLPFKCEPGCKVGDSSHLVVPYRTYVQIPVNSSLPPCYKICRCSERLMIEDCYLKPCSQPKNCRSKNSKIDHNKIFSSDCNKCICYNGKITCTKFICDNDAKQNSVSFTGLPCNCAPHYVPFCGADGKTYPSECIARCRKFQDNQMQYGSCMSIDPCSNNSCLSHQICIPKKKSVCLSINHRPCNQYECIGKNLDCSLEVGEPVCSSSNEQFENFCYLLKNKANFGYWGKCKKFCDNKKIVCGQNGETYQSECAAWADGVLLDYVGHCMAVGSVIRNKDSVSHCVGVKCQPLSPTNCIQVVPPGACCPLCGGGLQILFSKQQVDETLEIIKDIDQITIERVINSLQQHIQTAECSVFSHLGIHNALIVIIAPIYKSPTILQVKACVAEAEKIAMLIQNRNPILLTDVILSHLVAADTIHIQNSGNIATSCSKLIIATILICMLILQKSFI